MKRYRVFLAPLWLALAVAIVPAAQPNLERRTSIDVTAAAPRDVYGSIARTLGCDYAIADDIRQPVSMRLDNVTIRTALNALSESLGSSWRIEGNTLRVDRAGSAGTAREKNGVTGGVARGVRGGVAGGVSGGVQGGVVGGVPGGIGGVDFKERLERKTPADFRFENAPLDTVLKELGKIADLKIRVEEPKSVRPLTVDLSNRTILSAFNAIQEAVGGMDKRVVFAATIAGSDKRILLGVGPRRKP